MARGLGQPGQRISIFEGPFWNVILPLISGFVAWVLGLLAILIVYQICRSVGPWSVPAILLGIVLPVMLIVAIKRAEGAVTFASVVVGAMLSTFIIGVRVSMWYWIQENTRYVIWIPAGLWALFVIYCTAWYFITTIVDPYGPRAPMAVMQRNRPLMPWERGDE